MPSALRLVGTPSRDRLQLWVPLNVQINQHDSAESALLAQANLVKLTDDIQGTLAPSTHESYGTSLFAFHAFCNSNNIPEDQRAPASLTFISLFVSSMVGLYAGSTTQNYVYAVWAWHIIHRMCWQVNTEELDALLKSVEKSAPAASKQEKQDTFMVNYILKIRGALDMSNLLHIATYALKRACLTTTFYMTAQLGKFVLKSLECFDPATHVKPSDVQVETDRQGLRTTVFHLPATKVLPVAGKDAMWATQSNATDLEQALEEHLCTNAPPADGLLFTYRHMFWGKKATHRLLTCRRFLEVIGAAAAATGLMPLKGHGIRIGSTLEYLLQGMPFKAMKTKGCWESDAFLRYLHQHAQILAPYIQANLAQHKEFIHVVMLPVCH
ncbi:hypothetical protein FA15DRAFT_606980 [Coprinopsis marcescibilis]|uniref:DNA breaking-rejoining enzyme n=1 Tax=Coprinopsis marcescibilis TaxID=230819 RepID=A0A5C3KAD9_COPMA|nr:hypothetical protein FA15DRAFT_606980 [Coprinopsis marcescibilis]